MPSARPGTRYILHHALGSADRTLFGPGGRDNLNEPFIKLRDRCAQYGYLCQGIRDQRLEECRWIVFWDAWGVPVKNPFERLLFRLKVKLSGESTRDVFREAIRAKMGEKLVLIMSEPPTTCPRSYDPEIHRHFKIVLTWSPTLADGKKYHRLFIPNPTNFPKVKFVPFAERKLLVDISGYKFSAHQRELYTERRRLVRFFEQHYPADFDLYGEGWNMRFSEYLWRKLRNRNVQWEFYPSYRGRARHKWDVFPHYRFGVCYEAILDEPGYLSHRIFDCMRAGCVPVYLGASDVEHYVDSAAFVHRRHFRSNEELGRYLSNVGQAEHERYLEAGKRYLESGRFRPFLAEHFVDAFVRILGLDALPALQPIHR